MRPLFLPSLALAVLAAAAEARASAIAYVMASSELDGGRPATYAYNLIDGKDTTAWCSREDPRQEEIVLGFTDVVDITEIGFVVGAIRGDKLDKARSRVREVRISDGKTQRSVRLRDEEGLQIHALDPPAKGRRLILDVTNTFPGGDEAAPICMGEIAVRSKGRLLGGSDAVAKRVRALNTPSRRLLGTWIDDVGAPERTLLLALDGTFVYQYEPLLEGKPVRLRGKWTASHQSLTLEVGGKRHALKTTLGRIDDGEQQVEQLTLRGEAPDRSMIAEFRLAPARFE